MRNQITRVITAADLPEETKARDYLVAIELSKAEAIRTILESLHRSKELPSADLVNEALQAINSALERPELAMIKPWEFDDRLTGKYVAIRVSPEYSTVQINTRYL